MRITGKGEDWTIHCNADELTAILSELSKIGRFNLEEFILELKKSQKPAGNTSKIGETDTCAKAPGSQS